MESVYIHVYNFAQMRKTNYFWRDFLSIITEVALCVLHRRRMTAVDLFSFLYLRRPGFSGLVSASLDKIYDLFIYAIVRSVCAIY